MKYHIFKAFFIISLFCVVASSCEKEFSGIGDNTTHLQKEGDRIYILREGDPLPPLIDESCGDDVDILSKAGQDVTRHLGQTYKLEAYPTACKENLGYLPVIDYDRYINDHPECYYEDYYKRFSQSSYVFSSLSKYEDYKKEKDIVDAHANIKYSAFSLNAKGHYEYVFEHKDSTSRTYLYGEFFNQWKYKGYFLDINTNVNSAPEYLDYISESFLNKLHIRPPQDFINNYGAFFVTKYITGSQVTALYEAEKKNRSSMTKQSELDSLGAAIDASLGKKWIDSLSISGGGSVGNSSTHKENYGFTHIRYKLDGLRGPAQLEITQELGETVFDFSPWYDTLKDTTRYDIVQLPKGALIPLTDFIEESNIREEFNKYYNGISCLSQYETPYIMITVTEYKADDKLKCDVETELHTRYGNDKVFLALKEKKTLDKSDVHSYIAEELIRIGAIYPYVQVRCNEDVYVGKVFTIDVTGIPSGRCIRTMCGRAERTGVVMKQVEIPTTYVSDYLREEKARLAREYSNPRIVVKNEPGKIWPMKTYGYSMDEIPRLNVIFDKYVSDEEVDEYYRSGEIVIPENYCKFIDSKTGITYILDNSKYIAYSLYNKNVINRYFSEKFIEELPASKLKAKEDIRDYYTIIAL